MRRMAAMALAAVVLLALASPAFAGWGNDEFYPGDDPPRSLAGDENGCSRGALETATCSGETSSPPETTPNGNSGQGYSPPGKGDGK